MIHEIRKTLRARVTPGKKEALQRFFKTGPGEYGEDDMFLGVMVPDAREVADEFKGASFGVISSLLNSRVHEERLVALLILVKQYGSGSVLERKRIVDFYLSNASRVNNWDLVDLSAPRILGDWVLDHDRRILYKLVKSRLLWERRIAVLATFALIANDDFTDSLRLAEMLLRDEHDLMHKACGWTLREVGKRDKKMLREFLDRHVHEMPRTMLRYSIERMAEAERRRYMA